MKMIKLLVPFAFVSSALMSGGQTAEADFYAEELSEIVRLDAAADALWESAVTPAEVAALQARVRAAALKSIGEFPERTPLDVRKTGEEKFDGYRVEKLVFASRPNFHVTAHLYLPDSPKFSAPYPAILMPCGHGAAGKSLRTHARSAVVAAKAGFAALLCDPIDQGERLQADGELKTGVYGHRKAGLRAHLLGESLAQYRIWDGIRAIDLLVSRDDIDPKRIGCAGFSGGGTLTAYLNVFEQRIRAAAPSAFITSIPELAKGAGPQDSEQIIFGQLEFGLNHLGLLMARAPSPLLLGFSHDDFFPFAGSKATLSKATAWYAKRGYADRLDHLECPGRHGWYESERAGFVKWMSRWLNGDASVLPLDNTALNRLNAKPLAELDCGLADTNKPCVFVCGGSVRSLPGEKTIYELLADKAASFAHSCPPPAKEVVRKIVGIREDAPLANRRSTVRTVFSAGKDGVVTMDVANAIDYDRGVKKFWYKQKGPAEELAAMMMWRGENLIARQTEDILRAARAYRAENGEKPLVLKAERLTAIAAAHAFYLHQECFSTIELTDPPPSWKRILTDPNLEVNAVDVVHGAYPHYDWVELIGRGDYASHRPAPEKRCFRSAAVDAKIAEIVPKLKNRKLAWMFENCYPNTLDTTVHYRTDAAGDDETFVYTGDIHAMWLRDSAAQVWPYLSLVKQDEALRRMIRGVVRKQLELVRYDRYANAFNDVPASEATVIDHERDHVKLQKCVFERKYELDSLCYPIRLAYAYWKASDDATIFDASYAKTLRIIVDTMKEQQRKAGYKTPYYFARESICNDAIANYGWGRQTKPVGLIVSAFRPSDDATMLPFLVPSNLMAVDVLGKASEIANVVLKDEALAAECSALAAEVKSALERHAALVNPATNRRQWAFEVDGFGSAIFMDDANVPSLIAIPYFTDIPKDDPIYRATREFVWSENNPYFHKGKALTGIGGPHCGADTIWPMSLILRALTSDNDDEIRESIEMIVHSDADTGFIHESVNRDNAKRFSRKWFAWANTLFGELIVRLYDAGRLDLLNSVK